MMMNDKQSNSTHLHYSPSAKHSIGVRHEYLRDSKSHLNMVQLNNLLKRWNKKNEQANFYLKSAIGIAYEDNSIEPVGTIGIATDWETRRYFLSYENRILYAGDIEKNIHHKTRIGIAPYIGDYGDLHTWIMLQADYDAGKSDSFSATPLLRVFKGSHLIEAGYNFDNALQLNYIKRF